MRQSLSNLPRPSRMLVLRGALALAGLLAVLAFLQYFVDIDRDDLESLIDGAGILAPVTYAVVLFLGLSVPFNPISDLLTVAVAALLLDPWVAIFATFVAQSASVTLNYALARRYGPGIMRQLKERNVPLVSRVERHVTLRTVFLFRFALPLTGIGVDFISYLSGMRRLPFIPFYLASMIPWTLLSVVYFVSAGMLREVSPGLVLVPALILLAVTSLVVLVIRRIIGPTRAPSGAVAERGEDPGPTSGQEVLAVERERLQRLADRTLAVRIHLPADRIERHDRAQSIQDQVLLAFGALPPAKDPANPTPDEVAAVKAKVD